MTAESTDRFCEKLEQDIRYFRMEEELTYAEIIGCLTLAIAELATEALDEE